MVYRLTPQILTLQSQSREPITVYIDSPGGLLNYKELLFNLLNASNQEFAGPCRILTVVTSQAASAAADLLSSGNYALAYPHSTVLYHGVRVPGDRPLTAEESALLAQRLRAGNESYAVALARHTEFRFMFRFISLKRQIADVRKDNPGKQLSDLECLLTVLSEKISESAEGVLRNAYRRYGRYDELLQSAAKRWRKLGKKTYVQLEADQIRSILEFEIRKNKKNQHWRFETEGIHNLTDDFFLLNEYLATFQGERFKRLCSRWGRFLLNPEEEEEINRSPEEEREQKITEKVSPQLRPIWSFFMSLCHVLQQGDNQLSARDAFWLGLIDEVIGIEGLPSFRLFVEYSQQGAKEEKDEAKSDEAAQAIGAEVTSS